MTNRNLLNRSLEPLIARQIPDEQYSKFYGSRIKSTTIPQFQRYTLPTTQSNNRYYNTRILRQPNTNFANQSYDLPVVIGLGKRRKVYPNYASSKSLKITPTLQEQIKINQDVDKKREETMRKKQENEIFQLEYKQKIPLQLEDMVNNDNDTYRTLQKFNKGVDSLDKKIPANIPQVTSAEKQLVLSQLTPVVKSSAVPTKNIVLSPLQQNEQLLTNQVQQLLSRRESAKEVYDAHKIGNQVRQLLSQPIKDAYNVKKQVKPQLLEDVEDDEFDPIADELQRIKEGKVKISDSQILLEQTNESVRKKKKKKKSSQ